MPTKNNNPPVESREDRDERLEREEAQETSRARYYDFIKRINDAAVRYVFSKQHLNETRKKRQELRDMNPDEAKATIYKKVGFILLLLALPAIIVVDYLIVGAAIDFLLGLHRELQGYENFVFLKLLATTVLLLIEISIAIGVVWLKSKYKSKLSVALHWLAGIGLALALTLFAGSLMYQKIINETEQSVVFADEAATSMPVAAEEAEKAVPEIPTQKWMLLAAVCGTCFIIHIFALMKADTVANAAGWAGYAVRDGTLAGQERFSQAAADRESGNAEASYRDAYDHWEMHNAKFPNEPLPSASYEKTPNQLIPVMRLSPIAHRIINNLQNGAVENLDAAQPNQNNTQIVADVSAETDADDGGKGSNPPIGDTGNIGFNGNNNNGAAENDKAYNGFNVAENDNHAAGNTANHDAKNDNDAGNDFYRNNIDAQIRNSEGEV